LPRLGPYTRSEFPGSRGWSTIRIVGDLNTGSSGDDGSIIDEATVQRDRLSVRVR